jgi:2'-5' RNA ligase
LVITVRPGRRVLQRLIPRADSVLLVPVSLPATLLSARRQNHLRQPIPRHITLLYPFVPPRALDVEVVRAIERVLHGRSAFRYQLTRVGSFPNARYLVIEPPEPFIELIGAFERAWPEYPRYGGQFATTIPHVTIAEGRQMAGIEPSVQAHLPVQMVARHVELWRKHLIRGWRMYSRSELAPMRFPSRPGPNHRSTETPPQRRSDTPA